MRVFIFCVAFVACADMSPYQPVGVLAENAEGISSLTSDANFLYWTQSDEVMKASKEGERPPERLFESLGVHGRSITTDDTHVYWIAQDRYNSYLGSIMRMRKDGSETLQIAASESYPCGLVAHGDYVYWTNARPTGTTEPVLMRRAPKVGGTAETIATGPSFAGCELSADDEYLYIATENADTLYRIALPDGGDGYFESVTSAGHLAQSNKDDLPDNHRLGIFNNSTHVYWAVWSEPPSILAWTKGTFDVEVVTEAGFVTAITGDDDDIYFIDADYSNTLPLTGTVRRLAIGESDAVDVSSSSKPVGLAIDDDFVYWADGRWEVLYREQR